MLKKLAVVFFAFTLIACTTPRLPNPNTAGPIHTLGSGFFINSGIVKYAMTYKSVSLSDPVYAYAEFENPSDASKPLVKDLGKLVLSDRMMVLSPELPAIKNHTLYEVNLYLYSDEEMKNMIHKHTDKVLLQFPEIFLLDLKAEIIQ
ncbi:hypothetical protein [Neptunomonas sp.]|uniref:hypothetical protein n=1 Tax=Neptunomonas sp. TaxID=1971898 RepID=UPI003566EE92